MVTRHFLLGILVGVLLLVAGVAIYLWSKYKKLKQSMAVFFTDDCQTNYSQGLTWDWNLDSLPPGATGYSQEVALFLTKAAAMSSYFLCENTDDASLWPGIPSFDSSTLTNLVIPSESIGYTIYSPSTKVMLLVWRGTESQEDLATDATFAQVAAPQGAMGSVHKGFLNVVTDLQNTIKQQINKYQPSMLYVTGHSLGAGLTTLSSALLASRFSSMPVAAYAFASPDVGDAVFKTWANSIANLSIYRFQNTADLVPTIPPGLPNASYYEIGQNFLFTNDTGTAGGNHGLATYRAAIESNTWLSSS
jgi:hypothetical protein